MYIHLKKELYTIKNKRVKNSTIETKFDKFGNKVSMIETSNKFDRYKVIKEENLSFSRDTTASFPSVMLETSDKHDS